MADIAPIRFEHKIIDADGPLNPHVKVVGDITGNGLGDVVVASSKEGELVWYEAPSFTKHVIASGGSWSCDARLVDMDGDGDLDLLIPDWYVLDRLDWYENPAPHGDPARDPWTHHVIGAPRAHDIVVADLDGDGQMEIVTRTQGPDGNHFIIRKLVAGQWESRTVDCPEGEGLAVGDVNDDGKPEIVISDRWYELPDDILTGQLIEKPFAEWPPDAVIRLVDMNGDGRLDIVMTRSEGKHRLSWFEPPAEGGDGLWTEHVVDDSVDFAHSLEIGDIDNDGNLDIITAEMHQSERKRVLVYRNAGDGFHWTRQVVATTGSHELRIADTTGDGRLDLIGANWSGENQQVEVWQNLGVD